MQSVNNDMDELFRQAAKDYPLQTDSGDWDSVLKKMQGEDNNANEKSNEGRRYFFLLLLIPLLVVCTTYIKNDSTAIVNKLVKDQAYPNSTSNKETTTGARETNRVTAGIENDRIAISQNTQDNSISSINTGATNLFTAKTYATDRNNYTNRTRIKLPGSDITDFNKTSEQPFSINNNSISSNNVNEKTEANTTQTEISQNVIASAQPVQKPLVEKSKEEPQASATTKNEKKERQPKIRTSRFYFGFQLGPDFSMVKSVKIDGTGYSAGLLAGYNINKNFAVETGLLWDHKRYQSEGRYFSTEKLNWPHVNLLSVSGYCNMYEVPLNLRYNFSRNAKRSLFATAGVSSYLMKKENYDYYYQRYGAYGYGNKEYKNTTNNWLSIVHLSVGLQKKLGAIGDLRIEPYIKLPLHGVGIGSMPLRSTGIYLGITRTIR